MKPEAWALQPAASDPAPRRTSWRLLAALGALFLLGGAACAAYLTLHSWLARQDRYLAIDDTVSLAVGQASAAQADLLPTSTAVPPQAISAADGTPTPVAATGSPTAGATTVPSRPPSGATPPPIATPTPRPPASPTAAVRIRIPAIGVDRSIIEVPLAYNPGSGTWKRDYTKLFRGGGQDLVGHWGGSASPGQPGNMILVGHNYGYGYNGVFLHLGRLTAGQQIEVVNGAGQTFAYRVTTVVSVPWTKKNDQEMAQHLAYLSVGGPERLTLVTCGGSNWAPFPDRVYVVAAPAP